MPVPGGAPDAPYFLISYSHTAHNGEGDEGDERSPDTWVTKFYTDLCRAVEELTATPPGTRVGVFDRALWVKNDWRVGLPEALRTCRVLVPLYSPGYFRSEVCGQEWQAFADRATIAPAQAGEAPAIVPVMWEATAPGSLPPAARAVPVALGDVDAYAQHGLDGVIKLISHREDYDTVVRQVARRVVAAAGRTGPGPWPLAGLDALAKPFAWPAPPEPGVARLFVTVVAPHQGDLPSGRDQRYYGPAAWDWAPYQPASQESVARYTANFARRLGYQPYISDLRERERDLVIDGLVAHPELLIIDPWALMRPACRHLLARCNLAEKPWVQIVIPWNPADHETAKAKGQLRLALAAALRQKLEAGRVTSARAVEGVGSIRDLGQLLPLLIPAAGKRYLGHASAFPPAGSSVEKPALHGFTPDPPYSRECTGV